MSLIRLLSAGPSLMPLSGEPRKYRAARAGMLPTFGPVRANGAAAPSEAAHRGALAQARALSAVPQPEAGRGGARLEDVRVLRNDLRDADVEWRPLQNHGGPVGEGLAGRMAGLWRRLTRRWNGAPA